MASSAGGAELTSRRRGGGAKIAVDGGGGIILLGGAVIVAAAAGAALALFRSRTDRRRGPQPRPPPPQPSADQAVQFNEKGLVGVADGDTGTGLKSLIPLIQKGEILAHNSAETDRNPAVEIVTTTAESIESKLILEESETAHVEEFEVVEEEDDGGREENLPPISPRGEEPESSESDDEKEIIGDAGMCLQSLIQEGENLIHNSVEDGSIREIDQPPVFEIITAAAESIQSNPILEESEVTHIEKSVVVGKEEEGDKEETPLTIYQDEGTESSSSSEEEDDDDDDDDESEEEEEDTGEEGSDGAGSSIESSAEAVWPAEAIEQGEKALATELIKTRNCSEIDGKTKDAVDAAQDEKAAEFEHDKEADIAAKMAPITGLATMEGNKGVEFITTKTHSKGFLLLLALILAGLLLFCLRVLSSSTIAA